MRRIALSGLDEEAVAELLVGLADQEVPAEFVAAVTSETGGNPFFVREVILHLIEEGRVRREDGRWVADPVETLGIPEGVREVIGRRLSRLSEDTNRLLAVAAAFDAGFDLTDTATVAGLGEDAALDAIDEALAARVVRPGDGFDRYVFAHALFRHTLVGGVEPQSPGAATSCDRRPAREACRSRPDPEQALTLTRHFHQSAALPGAERGVPYALIAAEHAAARFAAGEQQHALSIVLELLPEDDERAAALHERAARAAILAGDRDAAILHARPAVEGAVGTDGPRAGVVVAIRLGRQAEKVQMNSGWPFGELAAPYRDAVDEASPEGVQLLAWDVDQAQFLDPDNPGIAVDSPAAATA